MGGKVTDRDFCRFHHLLPDTRGHHVGWSVHSINVDLIAGNNCTKVMKASFLIFGV